jgi:hypothetical protein
MADAPRQSQLKLRSELYTTSQLSQNPQIVHEVATLVNESYLGQPGRDSVSGRFKKDEELVEAIGEEGLTAVIFDDDPELDASTEAATKPVLIATSSIRLWKDADGVCVRRLIY